MSSFNFFYFPWLSPLFAKGHWKANPQLCGCETALKEKLRFFTVSDFRVKGGIRVPENGFLGFYQRTAIISQTRVVEKQPFGIKTNFKEFCYP